MPRRSKSYFVPGKKIDISLLVYYLPRYKIHRYLYIHMCVCVCFWHTFSKSILAFFPSHYKSSAHPRFGQALHARLITISQCCISKQMSDHHGLKTLYDVPGYNVVGISLLIISSFFWFKKKGRLSNLWSKSKCFDLEYEIEFLTLTFECISKFIKRYLL